MVQVHGCVRECGGLKVSICGGCVERSDAMSDFGLCSFEHHANYNCGMANIASLTPRRYRRNMLITRKGPHGTEYSVKGYSGILIRTPVCGF